MIEKIKADFSKHWVSWIGFIGLVAGFFVYLLWNPGQLLMITLFWVLIVWGMSIEAGIDKQGKYRTDKEMNGHYN